MSAEPVTLVYVGNVVQMMPCSLYKHSHPLIEAHHVCPESWWIAAGKPVSSPMRALCPNCHYSTHVVIDCIVRGKDYSLMPARCIALAQEAFPIAQANGLTPAPTL